MKLCILPVIDKAADCCTTTIIQSNVVNRLLPKLWIGSVFEILALLLLGINLILVGDVIGVLAGVTITIALDTLLVGQGWTTTTFFLLNLNDFGFTHLSIHKILIFYLKNFLYSRKFLLYAFE